MQSATSKGKRCGNVRGISSGRIFSTTKELAKYHVHENTDSEMWVSEDGKGLFNNFIYYQIIILNLSILIAVYSIILQGDIKNDDQGEEFMFWYSPWEIVQDQTGNEPGVTHLLSCYKKKYKIRIIRSGNSNSAYAPQEATLRYDGLYQVTRHWMEKHPQSNFKLYHFVFQRCSGQPELTKPTRTSPRTQSVLGKRLKSPEPTNTQRKIKKKKTTHSNQEQINKETTTKPTPSVSTRSSKKQKKVQPKQTHKKKASTSTTSWNYVPLQPNQLRSVNKLDSTKNLVLNMPLTRCFDPIFREGECAICLRKISPSIQCLSESEKDGEIDYKRFTTEIQKHIHHLLAHRKDVIYKINRNNVEHISNETCTNIKSNDIRMEMAINFLEE